MYYPVRLQEVTALQVKINYLFLPEEGQDLDSVLIWDHIVPLKNQMFQIVHCLLMS